MKTVCVYHSIDLDGWMSAAIVKHWFIQNNNRCFILKEGHFENGIRVESRSDLKYSDELYFIGYNYGQPIPDLSGYDKVIMCDVSFPPKEFLKLYNQVNTCITVIDHHISAINELQELMDTDNIEKSLNGLRDTNFAACELTWKYFFSNPIEKFGEIEEQNPMPEIVRLLGMYDSFRHKTKSFEMSSDGYNKAKQYLEEVNKLKEFESNKTSTDGYSLVYYANDVAKRLSEETKVLEFQYGARQVITNYEEAYDYLVQTTQPDKYMFNPLTAIEQNGKAIYQYLCTEAKQAYENGFEITFVEKNPYSDVHSGKHFYYRRFICINKERFNPINFGIDYHKDGYDGAACFHRRADGKWSFSLYNDNGEVDCSIIAKEYGGGGHKGASGFVVDDINAILK